MKKILFLGIIFMAILTNVFATTTKSIAIYGHRGARGLAPENTIPAYDTGLKIGINYVDMDVGLTKDGVVVVTHDLALNPDLTRDSKGKWITDKNILIKDLTWKELETYDVGKLKPSTIYGMGFPEQKAVPGTHIPSLQQVIDYVKKRAGEKVNFQVEIKTDPAHPDWTFPPEQMARAVVKVLKENHLDTRTDLQAFDWRVLQLIQKLNPNLATAYLVEADSMKLLTNKDPKVAGLWTAGFLLKDYDNSLPKMVAKLGGKVWGPESKMLTQENVTEAHQYGLRVVPWTIDTKAEMERMIALHVDGIITDRPDILRGVMAQHGFALPKKF
jgi:glycerophosphoryl diester phosphodiesterase